MLVALFQVLGKPRLNAPRSKRRPRRGIFYRYGSKWSGHSKTMWSTISRYCHSPFTYMFFGVSKWYNWYNKHIPLKMLAIFFWESIILHPATWQLETYHFWFLLRDGWYFQWVELGIVPPATIWEVIPLQIPWNPTAFKKDSCLPFVVVFSVVFSQVLVMFPRSQWEWKVKVS